MITTAALSEADKSAWCRTQGIYPAELEQWCASATTALAEPQDARASPQATRQDRKRIKELERELLRKDRALAETATSAGSVKKSRGDLQQGRGRMIALEDRRSLAKDITHAPDAGAAQTGLRGGRHRRTHVGAHLDVDVDEATTVWNSK